MACLLPPTPYIYIHISSYLWVGKKKLSAGRKEGATLKPKRNHVHKRYPEGLQSF
ncbi:uncharacterized protein G2W53_008226 [Senna tora]|uniref:Uncharacterized protein n=1 Tax=Senna tora TaxID=362788 RepID=A0A835CF07_9FABA|nr:uncharacterized protein G2W53_008226 [Senna tora]